ncbi:hypothetical protein DI392_00755 [Vibrio albus]|uniref:Uncharacterized protein n=1 Tax=Vibrio albus TaxID=2200953 RepID=A0A2U3BDJ9_9VIBR|nr:hypothetical protein [Vibrio albus]PWI34843.1 hypothetical protein DI392_00755 [Vibrio albus]
MVDTTDITALQTSVQDLMTQTMDLLEQYATLKAATQQALSVASNGDSTYALAAYESLQRVEAAMESLAEESIAFETKAALDAYTPTADANGCYPIAKVWNDETDYNGYYGYNNEVWSKSPYDPLKTAVQAAADSSISNALHLGQPNQFSLEQLVGTELPSVVTGTASASKINGVSCLTLDSDETGVLYGYYRFDASVFSSGVVSTSLMVANAPAGTTGEIALIERDSSFDILSDNAILTGRTTAVSNEYFELTALTLNASTQYVDIKIYFADTSELSQSVSFHSMCLVEGDNPIFRLPNLIVDTHERTEVLESRSDDVDYELTVLKSTANGDYLAEILPNIYKDWFNAHPDKYWSTYTPETALINNRVCLHFTETACYSKPISANEFDSSIFSVAIRCEKRSTPTLAGRILLIQYATTDNSEEVTRETLTLEAVGWDEYQDFVFNSIELDDSTNHITICIDVYSDFYVSDIAIVEGDVASYRRDSILDRITEVNDVLDSSAAFTYPNLLDDIDLADDYSDAGTGDLYTANLNNGSRVLVADDDNTSGAYKGPRVKRDRISGDTFNAGCTVFYAQSDSARVLVQQLDANGDEIRDLSDGNGDYRIEFDVNQVYSGESEDVVVTDKPIADNCISLQMAVFPNGSGVVVGKMFIREAGNKFTPFTPEIIMHRRPVYVSTEGDNTNLGSKDHPVASVAAAMAKGAHKIIVMDGIYSGDALSVDGRLFKSGVEVIADTSAIPVCRQGVEIGGFLASDGYTNVYEATSSIQPALWDESNPCGFVFGKSIPFHAITSDVRHPLHRGRSHISPHYIFKPVLSLELLESATDPSWFYDLATTTLYVNAITDIDPLTMTVIIPDGYSVKNLGPQHDVTIVNLTYEFAGLKMDAAGRFYLDSVMNIGSPGDGFSIDKTHGEDRYCSVIGASNDNWNCHNTVVETPRDDGYTNVASVSHSIDPYSAWAFDDGRSIHEQSHGSVDGGLFEFCGSTGFAPAQGAEETIRHAHVRDCGWENDREGGIAVVNDVQDDGHYTVCNAHNVLVERCRVGFSVLKDDGILNLYNTRTKDCTDASINAEAGLTNLFDHKDSGSPARISGDGTVNDETWS